MAPYDKFDAEAILTDPSLASVYHSLFALAQEFAILGYVETTRILISLLLSEYSSDWQLRRIGPLRLAFAETNRWPDEISAGERTEEALREIEPQIILNPRDDNPPPRDDAARLEYLLAHADNEYSDATTGSAAMDRSCALAEALEIAARLASARNSTLREIEQDPTVQQVLKTLSTRLHANQQIEYLTERRGIWPLLSSGALARSIPVDPAKLDALANEVIKTFTERFKHGRKLHHVETKSMKELLELLDHNMKTFGVDHFAQMEEEVPESLFNLPPATDEEISSLENELQVKLPSDYKEFLKITNGFGALWNGYFPKAPFYPVEEVDWADMYTEDSSIELHEDPCGYFDLRLPGGKPMPAYSKAVAIGGEDIFDIWFIPPEETKKMVEAYKEAMNGNELTDQVKDRVRKAVVSRYGSWEALDNLGWIVVDMDEGSGTSHGSLTQFLQAKAMQSAKNTLEEGADKNNACFSYSCKHAGSE